MRPRSLLSGVVIVLVAVWLAGCGDTPRPPVIQRENLAVRTPVLPEDMPYYKTPMPATTVPFSIVPPVQPTEGPDEARVRFGLYKDRSVLIDRSNLLIDFSDGRTTRSIQGNVNNAAWSSTEFDTPIVGTLTLSFTLVTSTGVLLSQGTFELPLNPDRIRQINFEVTDYNPMSPAMGGAGYKKFPVTQAYRGKPGSALYLVWGENSIKNPWVS